MKILPEFAVVMTALVLGGRAGGIGLGVWGGVGLAVLTFGFGAPAGEPPIDVMLIILAVVIAAAAMEAAGGTDFLVRVAERVIRGRPAQVTFVAPLVTWVFTVCTGTGHTVYALFPVIYEVAHGHGIRPERPMTVATIASQQAIVASPVSAAVAFMLDPAGGFGLSFVQLLTITMPATLAGVMAASLVQSRVGAEVPPARIEVAAAKPLPRSAGPGAALFLTGIAVVVLTGAFPALRRQLSMPAAIQIVMLSTAAAILTVGRVPASQLPRTKTLTAGVTSVIGIFGLSWLGSAFIASNKPVLELLLTGLVRSSPSLFALGLVAGSAVLFSQAATAKILMPLGLDLGLSGLQLAGMLPGVCGNFLIPGYGTLIAAAEFDRSGTTRFGRWVFDHSFLLPGCVATAVAIGVGSLLAAGH